MSLFTYRGPLTAVTLPDGTELVLATGKTVDLPPGPVLNDLKAMRRLVPVPVAANPEPIPAPAEPEPTFPRSRGGRSSFSTRSTKKGGAE